MKEVTLGDYENKIEEYVDETRENVNTNKSENYSTTETEIGTWIDGSKLYRRVVEFTSAGSDIAVVVTLPSNCVIRKIDGYVTDGDTTKIPLNWYWSETNLVGTYVHENNSLRQRITRDIYQSKTSVAIL